MAHFEAVAAATDKPVIVADFNQIFNNIGFLLNLEFGHSLGDAVLRAFAQRLVEVFDQILGILQAGSNGLLHLRERLRVLGEEQTGAQIGSCTP